MTAAAAVELTFGRVISDAQRRTDRRDGAVTRTDFVRLILFG
jgi:hypothetical protein